MLKFSVSKKSGNPTQQLKTLNRENELQLTDTIQRQIELNRLKLKDLSAMKHDIINSIFISDRPQFHSTKIDQSESQFGDSFSSFAMESSLFSTDSMFTNSTVSTCSSEDASIIDDINERVCITQHEAKIDGDLNIAIADRVHILHENEDYSFVKKIETGECGYVPTKCIKTKAAFLRTAEFV